MKNITLATDQKWMLTFFYITPTKVRFNLINSLMENDQLRLASAQKLAELSKLKELNERFSSRLSLNHQETGNGN